MAKSEAQKSDKVADGVEQKGKQWKPPRGIRYLDLATLCPLSPHGLQWRIKNQQSGKIHRKTKTFTTKELREEFARSLAGDVKQHGVAAYRLNEDETRQWRSFRAQVGDANLEDVVRVWMRYGNTGNSPKIKDASDEFILAKTAEGISASALGHYQKQVDRLVAKFGDISANAVTRENVADWLAGLTDDDGTPFSDRTRKDYLKRVRQIFDWLKVCGKISSNPCDGIKAPKIVPGEVGIYSLEQGRALFEKNEKQPRELLGRLALEAFAGLRFTSALKVTADDIKFAERGVVLPAQSIKTQRREYIDGLPDNLWAWLKWSKPETWKMTPRQYLEAKSAARVRADLPEIHNALRHSFCSYHIGAFKDASRTSVILCHTSPAMLWRHYKGKATAADGLEWFKINPPKKTKGSHEN